MTVSIGDTVKVGLSESHCFPNFDACSLGADIGKGRANATRTIPVAEL